jgi:hypothetical protein
MLKALYKILVMAGLILAILFYANKYFTPVEGPVKRWKSLYQLEENSIDILFLGNSHIGVGVDPNVIDSFVGCSSYSLSNEAVNMEQCYFNFIEALKTQSPKLLVLELFALRPTLRNDTSNAFVYANFDGYPLSLNKLQAIYAFRPPEDYIHCLFPSIRNHELWKDVDSLKFNSELYDAYDSNHVYRGHQPVMSVMDSNAIAKYRTNFVYDSKPYVLDETNEKYLALINQLAKESNITVLYVMCPTYYEMNNPYYHYKHAAILANAKKHKAAYIDFNVLSKQLNFTFKNFENVVRKNQHINQSGTMIVSDYLKVYLKENYRGVLVGERKGR